MRLGIRNGLPMLVVAVVSLTLGSSWSMAETPVYRFDFGPGQVEPGHTPVSSTTVYSKERVYGFDLGSSVVEVDRGESKPKPTAVRAGFCTSEKPFFFSVAVPEGNYNVTVTLGDPSGESTTTVKAESRRLMLEAVRTSLGQVVTRTFTVNVRDSKIAGGGGQVRLKSREQGVLHWDDKLTLEFNGARPCVASVEVKRVDDAITVYLAGDSTVTDQPLEPWNSWGQMLPRFFKAGVAIANHAESGEALRSFVSEKRLDKIMSTIKAGDYLLIQFGHNDQKEKGEGVGAFTTYAKSLEHYVDQARARGATPILVTPMNRRNFDADGKVNNSLGDYPEAVRRVARDKKVSLIDLNAMSKPFYETLGPATSKKAFVDNTHHNAYGSYELARCVVEGIKATEPSLAKHLVDDLAPFDPARPDPIDKFAIPASPQRSATVPDGS